MLGKRFEFGIFILFRGWTGFAQLFHWGLGSWNTQYCDTSIFLHGKTADYASEQICVHAYAMGNTILEFIYKKNITSRLTGSIHFSQLHRLSIEPQSLSAIDFIFSFKFQMTNICLSEGCNKFSNPYTISLLLRTLTSSDDRLIFKDYYLFDMCTKPKRNGEKHFNIYTNMLKDKRNQNQHKSCTYFRSIQ